MAINNETYFEFDDELDEGFTTIPNYILNDPRLTFKAVGVYVQILQYRNTGKHKVYLKSLSNYRVDKKTAVSTGLKELEECGYITRIQLRNEKGHMNGMKYIVRTKPIVKTVENTTSEPKTENLISDNPVSEITSLKIKSFKKENGFKKENKVVVDAETQLIDLYKTFKLEKRVMPHMIKLLKDNIHISLDIFEQIFIAAAEDSVSKKYAYIKDVIDKLNSKGITTLDQYELDYKNYKKSKKNKYESKGSSPKKTKFDNLSDEFNTYEKYDSDELKDISDKKRNNPDSIKSDATNDIGKVMYDRCVTSNWTNLHPVTKKYALEYAIKNNLDYVID